MIQLNKALRTGTGLQFCLEHNNALDSAMADLIAKADTNVQTDPVTGLIDSQESVLADSLKLMGSIKVNRSVISEE